MSPHSLTLKGLFFVKAHLGTVLDRCPLGAGHHDILWFQVFVHDACRNGEHFVVAGAKKDTGFIAHQKMEK